MPHTCSGTKSKHEKKERKIKLTIHAEQCMCASLSVPNGVLINAPAGRRLLKVRIGWCLFNTTKGDRKFVLQSFSPITDPVNKSEM